MFTAGLKCALVSESYRFRHTLVLDDTEGYFVIGGGKYVAGVEGYYGPVVYHRNRISPHSTVMSCTCTQLPSLPTSLVY